MLRFSPEVARSIPAGNIENASSGAGICAERAALAKAIASGEREFEAIAIVGNTKEPISPCGICRQSLIEFGEDILVIMANVKGEAMTAYGGRSSAQSLHCQVPENSFY